MQGILQQLRSFREMICANPNIDIEDRIKRLRQANFKMEYKQRQQGSGGGALATSPTGGAQMLSLGAGACRCFMPSGLGAMCTGVRKMEGRPPTYAAHLQTPPFPCLRSCLIRT